MLPLGVSLLIHAVALAYLPYYVDPFDSEPAGMEVSLRPEVEPIASPPPAPVPAADSNAQSTVSGGFEAIRGKNAGAPGAATGRAVPSDSGEVEEEKGEAVEIREPRAAAMDHPPSPFRLLPGPSSGERRGREGSRYNPALAGRVPRPREKRTVEPLTGGMDASTQPGLPDGAGSRFGSNAGGAAGAGVGGSFDFWAPPDYHEEMARAEGVIAEREKALEGAGTVDLGHGVICNTDGWWFVCEEVGLEDCNARYDRMCRFAKASERMELSREIVF